MYWPLGIPQIYSAFRTWEEHRSSENDSDSDKEEEKDYTRAALQGMRVSKNGTLFVTITETTLTVWQTSPIVLLAAVRRSQSSLASYGPNITLLLKPDASIAAVHTLRGFVVTYSISIDPKSKIYQQMGEHGTPGRMSETERIMSQKEREGFQEINIKFRMVIKIDAGIGNALALDDELIVATEKPAAVQCIRWTPDSSGKQTSTELISRMLWMPKKANVKEMVYDRAMSLAVWLTSDGHGYAVQRIPETFKDSSNPKKLFKGHEFHKPEDHGHNAVKAAINARFSLLAVGCKNSEVFVYTARDYVGSIPLSHKLHPPASAATCGCIQTLSYSPDGYCLFAGYEHGWAMWSVYGKLGANSFAADPTVTRKNSEDWLTNVSNVNWLYAGTSLLLTSRDDCRIWLLRLARSATTSCFAAANIARTLLLTDSSLMLFRGYDLPLNMTISGDASLWHSIEIPQIYLLNHRPIRTAVTSSDGRYVAVAGRRGLAHYSVSSGRWKTFEDFDSENAFVVRGGMCWHQHILIAAVETDEAYELRMYSREAGLRTSSVLFIEQLSSPVVVMSLTGQDSLLVYTYENVLYHFIINMASHSVSLVQVGQLALNGIVRAPARVRAVTWILPEDQLRDGDPSQDVAHASVIFLVDAKLVVLHSSTSDGDLKYDMRVIAHNVEYFDLMRDQGSLGSTPDHLMPHSPFAESPIMNESYADRSLRDSLWYFDGMEMRCWMDVEDLLRSTSTENERELPQPISMTTDFYPTSIILSRALFLGVDVDLVQRRDFQFAFFRQNIRTELFLPHILRRCLSQFDSAAASSLALRYQTLPYFSHALEILLHSVLDDEVDMHPSEDALLPSIISFLSSFPNYLDILVQCTRKTEVRSWRSLFAHLPPPQDLFEESLERGMLKTAGGYLIVLQTFQELTGSEQCVRLLRKAREAEDWDLCKELARFLMALDQSGDTLRDAVKKMDLTPANVESGQDSPRTDTRLKAPRPNPQSKTHVINGGFTKSTNFRDSEDQTSKSQTVSDDGGTLASEDYFSLRDS